MKPVVAGVKLEEEGISLKLMREMDSGEFAELPRIPHNELGGIDMEACRPLLAKEGITLPEEK
jgi:hypothetical protein